MIKRLTPREQVIAVMCLLAVSVYLAYYFVAIPLKDKVSYLEQKIEAEEKKYNKNIKLTHKAKALEGEFKEFSLKFKQDKANEQVMSSILSEIEQVAGDLKLHISDLKPKVVNRQEFYNRFSVSLTIESQFVPIIHFLFMVQNDPHFFSVEELRFDNGLQRENQNIRTTLVLSKIFVP